MTPENFVYWLQGYFEIGKPTKLNESQIQEIQNHLGLVLKKVTPEVTRQNFPLTKLDGGILNSPDSKQYCCSLTNLPNQNTPIDPGNVVITC